MIARLQLSLPQTPPTPFSPKPHQNHNPKPIPIASPFIPLKAAVSSPSPPLPAPRSSDTGLLFRQKLLYLENHLHLDSSKALSRNPDLRSTPLSSLQSVAACLASVGIQPHEAGRVLGMHPQLLTCDPRSHLHPVFHFLIRTVGIPFPDLRKCVVRCPRLLVSSVPDRLRPTLYFLRRLGFVGSHSISCQTTLLLVSSVEETLIPKIDYIQSLGFSYKETARMVLRSPGLLTFSIENNFRPKVDFLVDGMGRVLSELKDFPQYFSFSLEGKIKPRHRLLVEHGFSMTLAQMLKVSDGEFRDQLVEMRLRSVDTKM